MMQLSTPNDFQIIKKLKLLTKNSPIRKAVHYVARNPAIFNNSPIIVRGYHICNHDLYHLEVSCLERIQMGQHMVSGIHGINCPLFHDFPITEQYDSSFDEARVAFHEWLTRTSLLNTIKVFLWINWLVFQGINPLAVIYRHYKTIHTGRDFYLETRLRYFSDDLKLS